MKVIANRQMYGVYGSVETDEEFDVPYLLAEELRKKKLVRTPDDLTYDVKAIQPTSPDIEIEHPEPRTANKKR